jgi:hypothetical protein
MACCLAVSTAWAADGQLVITVVDDATSRPVACRMTLKTASGKPIRPKKVPFLNDHFLIPGEITLRLPLGVYGFELERGPEYPVTSGHFELIHFADDSKSVTLKRHVDMAANGWWSGDLDVRRAPADIELLMSAEDLHMAQVIPPKSDLPARSPGPQPVCVDGNRFYHLLASSQTRAGGSLQLFNLKSPLTVGGTDPESPSLMEIVERARATPNVWVDVARPYAWDLPVLIALGQVDSIELAYSQIGRDSIAGGEANGRPRNRAFYPEPLGNPRWSQDLYFRLLNCGLRIPPTAGSGSGVTNNPAGYNRMYVHVDGPLTYEKWWESLRAGRVTITNGPLLQPEVDRQYPGHVFQADAGQEVELEIGLTLSTRDPISYLEIIRDGRIEQSLRFADYAKSGRLPKLYFKRSGWFLIRVVTDHPKTYRFAMTAPYYVEIGGQPRISKDAAQFFLDWVYERARQIKIADAEQQRKVLEYHRKARDFWKDLVSKANAE